MGAEEGKLKMNGKHEGTVSVSDYRAGESKTKKAKITAVLI